MSQNRSQAKGKRQKAKGKRQKAKGKRHAGYFVNERFLIKFVSGDAHMADIAELS